MIPAKYAPLLFGLILSMCMSGIVSGVSTLSSVGLVDGFVGLWGGAWLKEIHRNINMLTFIRTLACCLLIGGGVQFVSYVLRRLSCPTRPATSI